MNRGSSMQNELTEPVTLTLINYKKQENMIKKAIFPVSIN